MDEREEQIDVVDEEDRPVTALSRQEVHLRGFMHRSVHVFLEDDRGRIFLQRRAWTKQQDPGRWDSSASGHVESGESYDVAAGRELEEELGIRVPLESLFQAGACSETGLEHSRLYRGRLPGGRPVPRPNPDEILEGRFVPIEEVRSWMVSAPDSFASSFRHLFVRYLREVCGAG